MLIERKEIIKEIEKHQKKAEEALMNYQETGYKRYEKSQQNHEDWAETLIAYLNSEDLLQKSKILIQKVEYWAMLAKDLKESDEALEKLKISNIILDDIEVTKKTIKM